MLTYDLSETGSSPLYEFLYRKIKEDILSGKISPDEKLPSKRALAAHLKLSVITVQNAYEQLLAEGYIYSKERSGYYSQKLTLTFSPPPLEQIIPQEAQKNYYIDLYSDSAPMDIFPLSVYTRLMRREISENKAIFFSPPPKFGALELREALSEHLYHEKGLRVSAENIIIGSGTQHLFELIILLLGTDRLWALENPGYKKLSCILSALKTPFIPINVTRSGLNISALKKSGATAVHVSPSHHFPTGAVMPARERSELLSWAQTEGCYIIEDDYDSEFRFNGRPIPPLFETDATGRVIYFNTFTKSIAPSVKISYMILPPTLMERFRTQFSFYSCPVPSLEQYTLARFISEGFFSKHLQRLKTYYRRRRDDVISSIKSSPLNSLSEISEENSGLHFLLHLKTSSSDEFIKSKAESLGIKSAFLSDFAYDFSPRFLHTMIISYSNLETDCLNKALLDLSKILSQKN